MTECAKCARMYDWMYKMHIDCEAPRVVLLDEYCEAPFVEVLTLPEGCTVDGQSQVDIGRCSQLPCRLQGLFLIKCPANCRVCPQLPYRLQGLLLTALQIARFALNCPADRKVSTLGSFTFDNQKSKCADTNV